MKLIKLIFLSSKNWCFVVTTIANQGDDTYFARTNLELYFFHKKVNYFCIYNFTIIFHVQ